MRTSTETLIKALQILAQEIESPDGVANAAIDEAAERLAEQEGRINQFIESISKLSNQVVDLQNHRDELERQNAELMVQVTDAFGDGYYDGFIDGAKHHEATDCNTDPTYLGDDAMRCSEIAEGSKSKRLGIASRQELMVRNAELVAQVAVLNDAAGYVLDAWSKASDSLGAAVHMLKIAINAAPAQSLRQIQADAVNALNLDEYDAGFLNDFGGGNVGWWQDYIRSELGSAHDFYQEQINKYAERVKAGE